jgi:plastocyanin
MRVPALRAGLVGLALLVPTSCVGGDSGPPSLVIEEVAFPSEPTEVQAGALVEVVNRDRVAHTVTSDAGGFDLEVDPETTTEFAVPREPGDYPVVCRIHPTMATTIVVTR